MKKLTNKEFLNFNYLAGLKTNPSKNVLSFIRTQADYENNTYISHLYLKQNENVSRALTLKNNSNYSWLDDISILIDTTDSTTKETYKSILSTYNIQNGEIDKLFEFNLPISNIFVIDSNTLLLSCNISQKDLLLLDPSNRNQYIQQLKENINFEEFDYVPFQSNGIGFTRGKTNQYFLYKIDTEDYVHITDFEYKWSLVHYELENDTVYFSKTINNGVPNFYSTLCSYNLRTNTMQTILEEPSHSISKVFRLKEDIYVFASDLKKYGINQNNDVYKVENGMLHKVVSFGLSDHNSIGSDVRFGQIQSSYIKEDHFYFIGTYKDHSPLYSFDGSKIEKVFSYQGSLDGIIEINDGLYAIGLFGNNLQEVYKLDFANESIHCVTTFNKKALHGFYISKPQHIEFENDGVTLDGWVLLPENYDDSKRYPSILSIHGGPKTIYSDVYYHEMQVWANAGYIVYYTNPRGGDCYNDAFSDIRGKYGTIDYSDIMKFTDIVSNSYALDKDRMGVTGGSYGGFMTNWIVSHTDRFKAAVTQRSISNWISFYGTSDIGLYFGSDQTSANPYDNIELMWEQSPLKHALKIKTPLLFIHSDEDYRCPIEQAMQLFSVLRNKGIKTKFVWFKGENHDLSRSGRPQSRLKRLDEILNWFNQNL